MPWSCRQLFACWVTSVLRLFQTRLQVEEIALLVWGHNASIRLTEYHVSEQFYYNMFLCEPAGFGSKNIFTLFAVHICTYNIMSFNLSSILFYYFISRLIIFFFHIWLWFLFPSTYPMMSILCVNCHHVLLFIFEHMLNRCVEKYTYINVTISVTQKVKIISIQYSFHWSYIFMLLLCKSIVRLS